jgi:hypothetical protein
MSSKEDSMEANQGQYTLADAKPGNIIIQAGMGGAARDWSYGGSFIFKMGDGKEMLRFEPDGTVLVRGVQVDEDRKIYEAFREWFQHAVITSGGRAL